LSGFKPYFINHGAITNKPNKFLKNAITKGCILVDINFIDACIIENNTVARIIKPMPLSTVFSLISTINKIL
jgi:hypothetical protein